MSQWKLFANASTNTSGPVQWMAAGYQQGSGNANEQANNIAFANGTNSSTPGAALIPPSHYGEANGTNQVPENFVLGQFAVTPYAANSTNRANTSGDSAKVFAPGWVVRKAFEGPITSILVGPYVTAGLGNGVTGNAGLISIANSGTGFANGETVLISGGSVNAVVQLVANTFMNLTNLSVTGTATTYANTDYFVVSNGAVVNAFGNVTTNVSGGVTNTTLQSGWYITQAGGYFPTGTVNTNLVVSVYQANGAARAAGGLTFVANVSAVTQGIVGGTVAQPGNAYPNGSIIIGEKPNGLYPNTSLSLNSTANGYNTTFTRESHVVKLNIGANSAAFTNLVAANTPVTVTVSGNNVLSYGINAVGVFLANTAAGINNTQLQTITWQAGANAGVYANGAGFWGLFGAGQVNTNIKVVFTFANGTGISNGGGTISANLSTSTGGTVQIGSLGGRAGRVMYETLVATRFIANGGIANATVSSQYFPQ